MGNLSHYFIRNIFTFLANKIELIDVLHGKITIGKLTATERANPILVSSTPNESGNAVKMFPVKINIMAVNLLICT